MTENGNGKYSSGVVDITPSMAKQLLEHNTLNRKVANSRVATFAADMKTGRWQLNGEAVVVASDETLMDGQHRLLACIKAGKPFRTFLTRGVENSTFMTLDQGAKRSLGDVLGIQGEANTGILAAALRLVAWAHDEPPYTNMGFSFGTRTVGELAKELPRYPNLAASVKFAAEHKAGRLIPPSIVALGHYMGLRYAPEHGAGDFYTAVTSGIGLAKEDPALTLRNWMLRKEGSVYGYEGRTMVVFATMRCWNAHCTGRTLERVWLGGETRTMRSPPGFFRDPWYQQQRGEA